MHQLLRETEEKPDVLSWTEERATQLSAAANQAKVARDQASLSWAIDGFLG